MRIERNTKAMPPITPRTAFAAASGWLIKENKKKPTTKKTMNRLTHVISDCSFFRP